MLNHSTQFVQKLWNYCNILHDDGLSYGDFVEQTVARGANTALVALYWQGGNRIREKVLRENGAEHGEGILATVSQEFCSKQIVHAQRRSIAREPIVATVSRQFTVEEQTR